MAVPSHLVVGVDEVRKRKSNCPHGTCEMFEESPDWSGLDYTHVNLTQEAWGLVSSFRLHIPGPSVGLNLVK